MLVIKNVREFAPDYWEYPNPYYKPEYKKWWVAGKEGGMHPTFISYNAPILYAGYQLFPRVRSQNPDACVWDIVKCGKVISQRVTLDSCKKYLKELHKK